MQTQSKLPQHRYLTRKIYFIFFTVLLFLPHTALPQMHAEIDWLRIFDNGSGGNDFVNDMTRDDNYNFYLAGRLEGPDGTPDLAVVSFSHQGDSLLDIRFASSPNAWDEASSVVVDNEKNIYASGRVTFGTTSSKAALMKFSSGGNITWSKFYYFDSDALQVVLDDNQNPVLGYINYDSSSAGFTKYSSAGDSIWTTNIHPDSGGSLHINYMLSDSTGNFYILLQQNFLVPDDSYQFGAVILALDKNGNILWKKNFDGDTPRKLILDNESNIIAINNGDGIIMKLKSNGDSLWSINTNTLLTDIAVDNYNNLLVSGYTGGIGYFDYRTQKFSPDGSLIWGREFNSNESLRDFATAVALDRDNNIYVTGSCHDMFTQGYCYTLRYDPEGNKIWQHRFDVPYGQSISPQKIYLDDSGYIYIGGDMSVYSLPSDFFLLKLKQAEGVGVNDNQALSKDFSLSQNYPNPFNPSTVIRYSLPSSEFVALKITDILGSKIAVLVNEEKDRGAHEITVNADGLASGIYLYTLKAGNFIESKKMTVIK